MHPPEPAEAALRDDLSQRANVGVEPSIMEHAENDALDLRGGVQLARRRRMAKGLSAMT